MLAPVHARMLWFALALPSLPLLEPTHTLADQWSILFQLEQHPDLNHVLTSGSYSPVGEFTSSPTGPTPRPDLTYVSGR